MLPRLCLSTLLALVTLTSLSESFDDKDDDAIIIEAAQSNHESLLRNSLWEPHSRHNNSNNWNRRSRASRQLWPAQQWPAQQWPSQQWPLVGWPGQQPSYPQQYPTYQQTCKTPSGRPGQCLAAKKCPSVLNAMEDKDVDTLFNLLRISPYQASQCISTWPNYTPMLCCPTSSPGYPPTTTTRPTTTRPTNPLYPSYPTHPTHPPLPTHPTPGTHPTHPPLPTHPPYPGYPTHPAYPGYPTQPPAYPGYPTQPPAYPGYPTHPPPKPTKPPTTPAPQWPPPRPTHPPQTPLPTRPPATSAPAYNGQCGVKGPYDKFIVGGTDAKHGEWPWIAAMYYGTKFICGGSLIDDRHILTAAHCVSHMTSTDVARIVIRLKDYNLHAYSDGQHLELKVARLIRHKGFSQRTLHNDVAVLTLRTPVQFSEALSPVCLSTSGDFSGRKAWAIGWGSLREGGPQPSVLQKVDLSIWSTDVCRSKYGHAAPGGITEHMICAGDPGKDSCSGDSGGPLMVDQGGRWYQIGIVSWGIGCGKGQYPGVYSSVSYFLPWVQRNIEKERVQ